MTVPRALVSGPLRDGGGGDMTDQRSRSRVAAHFDATVSWRGLTVPVISENISLRGMLCDAPWAWACRRAMPARCV
jgi:hypothetical protein